MINAHSRGVSIRVVQTIPTNDYQWNDSLALSNLGVIELRSLDLNKLIGAGILHTKLWIVDGQHFYVGSANTDWRALTQVSYSLYVMTVCPLSVIVCFCIVYHVHRLQYLPSEID